MSSKGCVPVMYVYDPPRRQFTGKERDAETGWITLGNWETEMGAMKTLETLVLISLLIPASLMLFSCNEVNRSPQCYVFPPGFRGWLSISYGVASADPPKFSQGCIVFDFEDKKHLETRLAAPLGWATDRFREAGSGGGDVRYDFEPGSIERGIREHTFIMDENRYTEWFFVGTLADLESMPRPSEVPVGIWNFNQTQELKRK